MAERALTDVPKLVLAMLAGALALQIGLKLAHPVVPPAASDLRPPPSQSSLRLASLGDPIPLAKLLMLYLQSFDYQAVNRIPLSGLELRHRAAMAAAGPLAGPARSVPTSGCEPSVCGCPG